jgi:hypothetical protein
MDDEETIGISIEEMGDDYTSGGCTSGGCTSVGCTSVGCTNVKHICVPKFVFIIPYRDRKEHLEQFRLHMNMILEDVNPHDYRFLVVHQCDTKTFNRGAMKNIGFIYASRLWPNDYRKMTFVFNDVDSMPMRKNMWDYNTRPGVVKHFFGFTYTLGGIVSINGGDYERIGGFPNYWGWGYEDNELQKRVEKAKFVIDRTVFYPIDDTTNIIQLNHGTLRIMNKDDFEKFSTNTVENLYTIKELKYDMEENRGIKNSVDVDFVNVSLFRTGYDESKKEQFVYNLKNGNRPIVSFKRKGGNPRMLMKFI